MVQNQLTTFPTPTTRSRSAQGFWNGHPSYGSYCRETKLEDITREDGTVETAAEQFKSLLTSKREEAKVPVHLHTANLDAFFLL
jgi:hypothetical protein